MTTHTVMTLTDAQRHYLRAAIACLLAVQGEAAAKIPSAAQGFCEILRNELLDIASADGSTAPLDHQDGAELADMLASGTLELRVPDRASGITPYYADAPGSYTDQVGPDEEAWRVPVLLTVVGAETALDAGAAAGEFLHRATQDDAVNADEVVQAFDVGTVPL
jgi:hypothetical protein